MSRTFFHNARVFIGVDDAVIDDGAVLIDGGTIVWAGARSEAPDTGDATPVDLDNKFVMPGMTEAHAHLSYANAAPTELDRQPVPVAMLDALDNARVVLGSGFTSAISFGSAQGIDIPLREAIASGRAPGPRLAASDRDLGATGSNADSSGIGREGHKILADGPWAVRAAVRSLAKKRCDIVKIFLDGEGLNAHAPPGILTYTDDEVAAAVDETHNRQMRIVCHSRSAAAVKQAVRHGIDIIGHANFLDDEAVEMLAAERDRLFVGPGLAWELALLERGTEVGISRAVAERAGYQIEVDATERSMRLLHDAGVRLVVGGDYGLSITPHGTNAVDLQIFVERFGMSHVDALLCATRNGGAAFDPAGRAGTLGPDTWADLVIVDGDPTRDVTILQDHARIHAVVKGGVITQGLAGDDPRIDIDATHL